MFALLGLDLTLDVQCAGQARDIASATQESRAFVEGGARSGELTALIQVPGKPAECFANLVVVADGSCMLDAFQQQCSDLRQLPLIVGQVRHREERPAMPRRSPSDDTERDSPGRASVPGRSHRGD